MCVCVYTCVFRFWSSSSPSLQRFFLLLAIALWLCCRSFVREKVVSTPQSAAKGEEEEKSQRRFIWFLSFSFPLLFLLFYSFVCDFLFSFSKKAVVETVSRKKGRSRRTKHLPRGGLSPSFPSFLSPVCLPLSRAFLVLPSFALATIHSS